MGKASSAKKVARAARAAGGRRYGQRRALGFPVVLTLVVVGGIALVVWARFQREATAHPRPATEDSPGDHWHAAYAINICGTVQPPDSDFNNEDPYGIHTHGDSVIHIHPFLNSAGGQNATMGRYFDTINLQVDDTSITLPDGTRYEEGTDDCDGEPAQLVVARWDSAAEAAEGEKPSQIYTSDFRDIRFRNDREAFTIAFLPEGADVPAPDSISQLDNLSDVVPAPDASTTTAPGATTTTAPGATTTTAPGATTTLTP
jgi:hypothetical protein